MEDYRSLINKRWGSYKALSQEAGVHYSTVCRNVIEHEAGNEKATKRLQCIMEQADKYRRIYTRRDFRLKMESRGLTYEALSSLCKQYLPHIKSARIRHYINSMSSTKPTCPTYQALKAVLFS